MVNYVSVDKDAALLGASAIYYRLKQVDFDGKFEYHGPVVVNLETTIESLSVEIYPNPFNNSINLEFNEANAGTAQVVFTDLQGRVVKSMNLEINKGYGNYQVNELDNLKDGIYLMQVSLNGVVKTKKVVKSFN
jgi:hypothetical protein